MKIFYKKKGVILAFLMTLFCAEFSQAQNLLDLSYWTIGQGTAGGFGSLSAASANIREWGDGPDGKRAILWKAIPDGVSDANGGWNTNPLSIDNSRGYRFTVWIKRTNLIASGSTYFGCSNVTELSGATNDNPYFYAGTLPNVDRWYLMVGYIHGIGDNSTVNLGGVYDGVTGVKVITCADYKFRATAVNVYHRAYLYYDVNVNDRQYFYAPRVEVVNGNEPSIESLLNLPATAGLNTYFPGNVGIKTQNPGSYELAVNGNIRAKEIKVETSWSDFVFERNYPLLPLGDVEAFIEKNKHLPDVPSEKEVLKNGVELGAVNSRLLQKIEELTLYVIQLNKEVKELKAENARQKK